MENMDKIDIIDQRIALWQSSIDSVMEEIKTLEDGKQILNEDNGNKQIDIPARIAHGYEYIEMCKGKIAIFQSQKNLLTN